MQLRAGSQAFLAVALWSILAAPVGAGQSPADTVAIKHRMLAYTKARHFHDIQALRHVLHPHIYSHMRDSLPSMLAQFRSRFPNAQLSATSPDLRRFLNERTPDDTVHRDLLEIFATAFRKLEAGSVPEDAALALLAPGLLPPSQSVDSSRFEFVRWEDGTAVYYLTEYRARPLQHTRRVIVEWQRVGRDWFLTAVR